MKSRRLSPLRFKTSALRAATWFVALCWLVFSVPAAQGEELWIVTHQDSPVSSITVDELAHVYLGMKTFFDSGEKIIPLDLGPLKAAFYEKVLNKQMGQINKYWTKAIFSGKGTPPKEFSNLQSLLAYMNETPGSIVYLPAGTNVGKLKVLKIVP